ncbi:DUF2617 family protein, partial [Streptomyces sp. NPDC079189]|uniref:DUF2617 family protein n=1 Tax=Streptomyces sp. NPDC079189 TaxID=3154514 RepID=UPI00342B0140
MVSVMSTETSSTAAARTARTVVARVMEILRGTPAALTSARTRRQICRAERWPRERSVLGGPRTPGSATRERSAAKEGTSGARCRAGSGTWMPSGSGNRAPPGPGLRAAPTGHPGSRTVRWRTWHAYPQEGQLVVT